MAHLGPEYIGKLPPGADKDLERQLDSYKQARKYGALKGVLVLSGPGCPVAEAQDGKVYSLDDVPKLPFSGCKRAPCCACCYAGA